MGEAERQSRSSAPAEAELETLARGSGALRRVLAALAGAFAAQRAHEALGYARAADYARERLGQSARWMQELAQMDARLRDLPRLEAALVSGELSWSTARLLARFVSPRDEAGWIARARGAPVRALERELRAADRGALTAAALGPVGHDGEDSVASMSVRAPMATHFKWQRTCRYAERVAGETTPPARARSCEGRISTLITPMDVMRRSTTSTATSGEPTVQSKVPSEGRVAETIAALRSGEPAALLLSGRGGARARIGDGPIALRLRRVAGCCRIVFRRVWSGAQGCRRLNGSRISLNWSWTSCRACGI